MEQSSFQFSSSFTVTDTVKDTVKKAFDESGFIIVRNLLNNAEVNKLKQNLENNQMLVANDNQTRRIDEDGMKNKSVIWKNTGSDITGLIARSEKVVNTAESLIEGKVEHYHSKVIMKETNTGAFPWHQDYGYWYRYGFLLPYMVTTWIAVDKADRENGCLQVLKGSHKAGRLDTFKQVNSWVADKERTEQLKTIFELVHCEMEPGDALFFHCNLLHYSAANMTDRRRWAFLMGYNRTDNPATGHPCTPIDKVANSAILEDDVPATDDKTYFKFNPDVVDFQIE